MTLNRGPRFFHFAFTSAEITAPITLPSADIPPSEPPSACFYFFHIKGATILLFLYANQHPPPGAAPLSPSHFLPSQTHSQSLMNPENNGKQRRRANGRRRALPLALQRCPIVYCLPFISFSPSLSLSLLFFSRLLCCRRLLFRTRCAREVKKKGPTRGASSLQMRSWCFVSEGFKKWTILVHYVKQCFKYKICRAPPRPLPA